ncbi:MAG: 1-(5-phosphoribosyl)-5-[(5-phosphoribosylamino)methylideneamino]imidazole-4-carboxamide isomerase [Candidatus Omnitrophica bacterium]|jgi:phosphoribosylformimino-5-aminoimidazole carboxamide ribotide isomerase|nr:1-(5-phosphoribosyl)-5-[(5-phosphoribosylamino)methylideneamino]imidazole-4-carboxamide isomerase [Candidatus Omnitrophota bacterium]MDD5078876.1 1-(5-phosphoribosyl)-5-[(5-phosphoribosylamino)methylideneamino]imidazole-4-carboxamide isomerase [Candidatus Omnitrophota bacterium]
MLIIPAIDLKGGNVVRLFQGKGEETVYSRNPVVFARHWQKQGAGLIHVVDLDGAFSGKPQNLAAVKKIVEAVDTPIEFGGGVRDEKTIKDIFAIGVSRIVLGTRAVEDSQFLKDMLAKYAEKIIVSIDAKNGVVMTEGWQSASQGKLGAIDFAKALEDAGFKQVIYTDTSKDGTLRGPDIGGIAQILKDTGLNVVASGGISCLEDLNKLYSLDPKRVCGVIIGKALYEEKFTLKEAIKLTGGSLQDAG